MHYEANRYTIVLSEVFDKLGIPEFNQSACLCIKKAKVPAVFFFFFHFSSFESKRQGSICKLWTLKFVIWQKNITLLSSTANTTLYLNLNNNFWLQFIHL